MIARPRPTTSAAQRRAELLLLAAILVWSLNFTITKVALDRFLPLAYTAPRYALAGFALGAVAIRREGTIRVRRRDAKLLLGASIVGIWLNQLAFMYAIRLAGAASVSLLFGTAPILVVLCLGVTGIERLGRRSWIATGVSAVGVGVLVLGSGEGVSSNRLGLFLCLLSSASWALYSVALVPLTRNYSPYRLSAVLTLAASVPLLATALPQLLRQNWHAVGVGGWLAFLYGLVPSYVLSNLAWFHAIERVGAARAALFVNLEPFLGALFAVVLLSEHIDALQVVGGILTAVALAVLPRHRKRGERSQTDVITAAAPPGGVSLPTEAT